MNEDRDRRAPEAPHELAAAYAVDALDADERATFEAHLATCPACQDEVASLAELPVMLTEDLSVDPPASLREHLLAEVAATPQGRGAGTDELERRRARRGRHPRAWLLAGAAAAAIVVGALVVTQWPSGTPDPSIVAVQEVLDAPDAVRASESVDGATVTVVTAYSLDASVVLTEAMDAAPEGQDYQLWFVHEDGTAVSAGLMPRDDDRVLLEGDPTDAVAVGITVEPAGGSDQPTSDPLVAVPLGG